MVYRTKARRALFLERWPETLDLIELSTYDVKNLFGCGGERANNNPQKKPTTTAAQERRNQSSCFAPKNELRSCTARCYQLVPSKRFCPNRPRLPKSRLANGAKRSRFGREGRARTQTEIAALKSLRLPQRFRLAVVEMPTAGISASPEIVASKSLRQFFVTANSSRLAFPFSRCLKIPGPTTLGGRKARREMSESGRTKKP